ncbi:hypothetical protein [Massilia timonae]|uniref:hypothetical protein n=1 Tax=Massilia timonae TaxID=47229 RepID=UPI0028D75E67|nr:hypothetical protein [Massilia timonae]
MTTTIRTQAVSGAELQRRVDDLPLPAQPLEWGDDGTPLEPSSVVYFRRPVDKRFPLWEQIKTQERLAETKAAPGRFELLTLFTVPVDDLARAPLVTILEARLSLDRIEAKTRAAIDGWRQAQHAAVVARLRDVLSLLGGKP